MTNLCSGDVNESMNGGGLQEFPHNVHDGSSMEPWWMVSRKRLARHPLVQALIHGASRVGYG